MDRCAGIVLFYSALKEIIDLHYSPTHKTQPATHTHRLTYAHIFTVPPLWLHHLPHGSPTPWLLIKERMFISLPVFYRGGVLSPGFWYHLTWADPRGKAITPRHEALQARSDGVKTRHYLTKNIHLDALNEGYCRRLNLSHCHAWLISWLKQIKPISL